jgi:hypothetical protein
LNEREERKKESERERERERGERKNLERTKKETYELLDTSFGRFGPQNIYN